MQKVNLKLEHRKGPRELDGGGVSSETSLNAWVWAERISVRDTGSL
jgi:hypothetical protein